MNMSYHKSMIQSSEQSQPTQIQIQRYLPRCLTPVSTGCVSVILRLKMQSCLGNNAIDALFYFCTIDYRLKQSNRLYSLISQFFKFNQCYRLYLLTLMQKAHQVSRLRISLHNSPSPVAAESDSFTICPLFQPMNLVHLATKQSTKERF